MNFIDDIIRDFKNSGGTLRDLDNIITHHLVIYNEEQFKEIEQKVIEASKGLYFINTNPEVLITPVELSAILYNNLTDVKQQVKRIVGEFIKSKSTIKELSKKLYEGYEFNDKEVLDVKKKLPKYIQVIIEDKKAGKDIVKQINKIKTKGLKASYRKILQLLENESDKAMEKAVRVALEEKSRYYADRIARTEIVRGQNLSRAKEYHEDKNIEFLKFEINPAHKKTDICDFYASLDVGYGAGIYPKGEVRATPLHPFCGCFYRPIYITKKKKGRPKKIETAGKEYLKNKSDEELKEIFGTYAMVEKFRAGENIEDIFNTIRPKYKIKKYSEILKELKE